MLKEHTGRLFREVYMQYTEFKESDIMKDWLLTYSEEAALKARKQTRREEAKRYREREKKVVEKTQREAMLNTARKMKELNLPAAQIAVVSGLSSAEIAKL
jgi:hypothetical protein